MSYKPFYRDTKGNLIYLPLHIEKSDVADKLGNETVGSTKEPIFLKDGVPKKCDELNLKIVDLIYPVGSIYISSSSVNPATLFGHGTWEQIKDKFLLSAGNNHANGQTGGEETHTLTGNEIPSHTHNVSLGESGTHTHAVYSNDTWSSNAVGLYHGTKSAGVAGVDQWGGSEWYSKTQSHGEQVLADDGNHSHSVSIGATGGGQAHNNMPPYLVVYVWKRTA